MQGEVIGIIEEVFETEVKSEKFSVRKFAIKEIVGEYPEIILCELTNAKIPLIDGFKVGDCVKATAKLKGRCSPKDGVNRYYNRVEVWKMEAA